MGKNETVTVDVWGKKISLNIPGMHKLAFVDYTPEMYELIKEAKIKIPGTDKAIKDYKYPYSNKYKKALHQIAFDYYYGEELRKKAYSQNYIIEHLDNDGFNCTISNLFLLRKIKNTYKGWHLDKVVKENKYIAALTVFHVHENQSFQITIAFNETFTNKETGKVLDRVRLLYPYNYEIVLQDAEQIIESISKKEVINFSEWKSLYRFKDIHIDYEVEIELTEEEKLQPPGTMIIRDGQYYFLAGRSESSVGIVSSIPYEENWNPEE